MGRSGGSSGGGGRSSGGGHSSGGFSGGHSSGGFSGGGRSSGGSFGGGGRTGGFSGGNPGPRRDPGPDRRPPRPIGPIWGRPYYGPGPEPHHRFGIWRTILIIIIVMMVLSILFSFAGSRNEYSSVTKNTTERTALEGVVSKTDWYEDNIGWISSKSTLISGLEEFYKETGVQPYILFVEYSSDLWNGNTLNSTAADEYLEEVYAEKFTDEGHFIFAYFQCANDSKAEMEGEFRYLMGYSVDTIMDSEAISILWGYFEINYYDTSLSIEEMISNTFEQTAESIMSSPTNGWDVLKVILIIVAIIIIVVIIYKMVKNKQKRDKEKEEYTKDILDKPLETFGTDTSELEKKYEDK